jgi:hypothetical protein
MGRRPYPEGRVIRPLHRAAVALLALGSCSKEARSNDVVFVSNEATNQE